MRQTVIPTAWMLLFLVMVTRCPIKQANATTLNPAYNWITTDKIRGGYMNWSDLGDGLQHVKAVGLNAVFPKFPFFQAPPDQKNIDSLQKWGAMAKQTGLHFFPAINFHGGNETITGDRRYVDAAGHTFNRTPCPLDQDYWDRYVVNPMEYLAVHANDFGLSGAVMDPEMYSSDHALYTEPCYCSYCFTEFCKAGGIPVPDPLPAPADRAAWLKANGLDKRYEQHFVNTVASFGQELEQKCHQADSQFILGIYDGDYPGLYMRGLDMSLGTASRPFICLSENSYSVGYTGAIARQEKAFSDMNAHVIFVPGLWLQQIPTENLAEQFYACAAHSGGYWVYTVESLLQDLTRLQSYRLPEPNAQYWDAMNVANKELDRFVGSHGRYVSSFKVRPFAPPPPMVDTSDIKIRHLVPSPDGNPSALGPITEPRLRYRDPLFIVCRQGELVSVLVTNVQLSNYRMGTTWIVMDPNGQQVGEGHWKAGQSTRVRFYPKMNGVYAIIAASGANAQTMVMQTGQPYAFIATQQKPFSVSGAFGRMYFFVPQGVTGFSFFFRAVGQVAGRGGNVKVYSPDGQIQAQIQGDFGAVTELPVQVSPEMQGRVWCVSITDVTNDLFVYFSKGYPSPYLSPDPTRVLTQ